MKIGILTLYSNNANMGGQLQAYALAMALGRYCHSVEQISFDYLKYYASNNPTKSNRLKEIIWLLRSIKKAPVFWKRILRFRCFQHRIKHSSKHYLLNFCQDYDCIVVGSDQVWGEWLPPRALELFLLKDCDVKNKRYSYAASIGSDYFSENHGDILKQSLNDFDSLSVREISAAKQLRKIFPNKEILVHIDPTLLLTTAEWDKLQKPAKHPPKYVFCYFLGKERFYREYAKIFAKRFHLPIVTMPYIKDNIVEGYEDDFGDVVDISSGPSEFIHLIKNAEVVLTDSFHASVFSLQYHIPFYAMARIINETNSSNTRMTDLLDLFALSDRYICAEQLASIRVYDDINFDKFDKNIIALRREANDYLKRIVSEQSE